MTRFFVLLLLCLLAVLAPVARVDACNVPVFRYALERWRPDPYEVIVIHRGLLGEQEQTIVDSLRKYAEGSDCISNFNIETVDLSKSEPAEQQKLLKAYKIPQFPWVIVRYPEAADSDGPAWAGPLDAGGLRNLLDSPIRKELVKRLLKGESAVWLFLESGDKIKDEKVASILQNRLQELEKTLKLPQLTDTPKDKLLREELPLKISFSVMRLSRTDPEEKILVNMLRHMEKDLSQSAEPMVFPVFGRGLALYALVGKGITQENIGEAAAFLVGACSCEVKRLNPGVDLLMTANWEGELTGQLEPAPDVPLVGLLKQAVPAPGTPSEVACSTDPTSSAPTVEAVAETCCGSTMLPWAVGIALGGALLAVALATLVLYCRNPVS